MHFTQVAYGGCWKAPHAWQRCRASTPCLAESQKGLVSSFGTGMGLVTALQSLIVMVWSFRAGSTARPGSQDVGHGKPCQVHGALQCPDSHQFQRGGA